MPNHVKNKLEFTGNSEVIELIFKKYSSLKLDGTSYFPDFMKIIPMPKDTRDCINWACNTWGSKWNSYDTEKVSENIFVFHTAWSGVPSIVEEISKKFPKIKIVYEWSDEDIGSNCARYTFLNGGKECTLFENRSLKAYELAFKLRPEIREDYLLIDNKWEWVGE